MKAAIRSLVIVVVLAAAAGSADARPPRFSGLNYVPSNTAPSYDIPRYTGGYSLPYSARGSSFSDYGVPYNPAYARNPSAGAVTRPIDSGFSGGSVTGSSSLFRGLRR